MSDWRSLTASLVLASCTAIACGQPVPAPGDQDPNGAPLATAPIGQLTDASLPTERPSLDELDALIRGLRNEALQVRRAKELADFSMEPDTHAAALRAQTPEVTTANAAALVGMPVERYRNLRAAATRALGGQGPAEQPLANMAPEERARMSDLTAVWDAYSAALGEEPGHER